MKLGLGLGSWYKKENIGINTLLDWILSDTTWNDNNFWVDSETWND